MSPGSKAEAESLEGAAGRGHGGAQGSDRILAAIRWGRGRRAGCWRARTWALAAALIIVACLAVWGPVRGLASFRPAWALGAASSTRPSAPAVSSGSPSVSVSPSTPGSASATAPVPRMTQGDAEGMVGVVITLSAARDRALMAADAGALAARRSSSRPLPRPTRSFWTSCLSRARASKVCRPPSVRSLRWSCPTTQLISGPVRGQCGSRCLKAPRHARVLPGGVRCPLPAPGRSCSSWFQNRGASPTFGLCHEPDRVPRGGSVRFRVDGLVAGALKEPVGVGDHRS